jgi:hypothetical protein
MIGVALAKWLLARDPHDSLNGTPGREAEPLEQFHGRGGLPEAIYSDNVSYAPDVLMPEARRARLDSNAR